MDRGQHRKSPSPVSKILSPGQELEELRAKAEALEAEARIRVRRRGESLPRAAAAAAG